MSGHTRIIHFWASATSNWPQQLSMYSDLVINEGRDDVP